MNDILSVLERFASAGDPSTDKPVMFVEPEVTLLGITRPMDDGTVEQHLERAARECYRSQKKTASDSTVRFLRGIIVRGHESILEHASATFKVVGGSRAYTHEQVRHRLLSFSQQSQRFVSEANFRAVMPPEVAKSPETAKVFAAFVVAARSLYKRLKAAGIKNEDARFVLPNAVESGIVISGNFREWRHVVGLRLSPSAQWEIRAVTAKMLEILKAEAPTVFGDFILNRIDNTVTHLSETVSCEAARAKIAETVLGEPRILRALGDDSVYAALFHVRRCLSQACRESLALCGDLK
jgi:thymidylate synthase (FAD)